MSDSAKPAQPPAPLGPKDVINLKGRRKLSMLTAYDYGMACILDKSGLDMILVGDSLGMVMLGRPDTLSVTLEEMIHHARAVVAGAPNTMVVVDLPFMSYEISVPDAMKNAARLCQASGARAVKLEGGRQVAPQVKALVQAGIPVMGHVGLTPQRTAVLGGFKVQGKTAAAALELMEDALALQEAGAFAVVLEAIPAPLAALVTARLAIPTIGIGAGPDCDGQVLVLHDVLGLYDRFTPRFVKKYAALGELIRQSADAYCREVSDGAFPASEHCFKMDDKELAEAEAALIAGGSK